MAFPPRPPMGMMPGLPPPPSMMYSMPPMGPVPPHIQQGPTISRPRQPYAPRPRPPMPGRDPNAPSVTVFVGNISERSQDQMMRQILQTCGPIISWKRVQGATGKLQAFGFCEYGSPEIGLRAIRLLHDFEIGDKRLVVKVDSKTQGTLDEYIKKLFKEECGKSPEPEDVEKGFMTDVLQREDESVQEKINAILKDHEKELKSTEPTDSRRRPDNLEPRQSGPKQSLAEVELESDKREIIHREIDKFREIMKRREAEKEEEKKNREKDRDGDRGDRGHRDRDRERDRDRNRDYNRDRGDRDRDRDRDRNRDRDRAERDRESSKGKSRRESPPRESREPSVIEIIEPDPEPPSRRRSKSGSERRSMSRTRGRSNSRMRDKSPSRPIGRAGTPESRSNRSKMFRDTRSKSRSRSRSRERRDPSRKSTKELRKEEEMEEEARERKKEEIKAREKESSYQERLHRWEDREANKIKTLERDAERERRVLEERERDAKKLRQFLEDYLDDRDDPKYYKGSKLDQKRLERAREMERDLEDRRKETAEFEELKLQIAREGYSDPDGELQRRIAFQESIERQQHFHLQLEQSGMGVNGNEQIASSIAIIDQPDPPSDEDDDDDDDRHGGSPSYGNDDDYNDDSPDGANPPEMVPLPSAPPAKSPVAIVLNPKPSSFQVSGRRKIDVKAVFGQDDDESSAPKRPRLPLPPSSESSKHHDSSSSKKNRKDPDEEKRQHIKSLIEKIPTDKKALFEFKVEWNMVDEQLMDKRIRPWVNKKITEYIGEPEPSLSEFICTKVLQGSPPSDILADVQVVLDDEGEVFVVKLWRLLIYEIENKKVKMATTGKT